MNFQSLYQELNRRFHGTTENADYFASLKCWLNLGRSDIVLVNPDWNFLQVVGSITLVAAQMEYTLATDVLRVNPEAVYFGTTYKQLPYLEFQRLEFATETPGTTGATCGFRLNGYQKMQLFPPPDAAVLAAEATLKYEYAKFFPTDMVNDSDAHGLPIVLEPVLLLLAEEKGWRYFRRFDLADMAVRAAVGLMQGMLPGTDLMQRFTTMRMVQPVGG